MEALIFDTTFLIDFQRERKNGDGLAHRVLINHEDYYARISVISFGEFAEGFQSLNDPVLLSIADSFEVLPVDVPVARVYAQLTRTLRRNGYLIDSNDLWIAATALHYTYPVITRNLEHFTRVPGLQVRNY